MLLGLGQGQDCCRQETVSSLQALLKHISGDSGSVHLHPPPRYCVELSLGPPQPRTLTFNENSWCPTNLVFVSTQPLNIDNFVFIIFLLNYWRCLVAKMCPPSESTPRSVAGLGVSWPLPRNAKQRSRRSVTVSQCNVKPSPAPSGKVGTARPPRTCSDPQILSQQTATSLEILWEWVKWQYPHRLPHQVQRGHGVPTVSGCAGHGGEAVCCQQRPGLTRPWQQTAAETAGVKQSICRIAAFLIIKCPCASRSPASCLVFRGGLM